MSLILIEGFPIGWNGILSQPDGSQYYRGKWAETWLRTGGTAARHGSWGAHPGSGAVHGVSVMLRKQMTASEKDDFMVVGFATKLFSGTNYNIMDLAGDANATTHLRLGIQAGQLEIYRGPGSTLLGSAAVPGISGAGGWYYIEVVARLHDSTGSVEVWLDGVQIITFTGDTKNGGTDPTFDNVRFVTTSALDDIYILNEQGSSNTSRLGDCRVESLAYNANGSNSAWVGSDGNSTDNYLLIDDFNYDNIGGDYVTSGTTGDTDTYNTSNPTLTGNEAINGVEQWAYARKMDAGARTMAFVVLTGSGTAVSADQALSGTQLELESVVWNEDPTTSAPWTSGGFNAAEFGHRARP